MGQFGEDPVAELVAGARKRESGVRVQALEAAGARGAPDPDRQLWTDAQLLLLSGVQARRKIGVFAHGFRPTLDTTRCLEPRDRGDEVRTRQPVRRGERIAVLVERLLLGYRRTPERAGTPKRRNARGSRPTC